MEYITEHFTEEFLKKESIIYHVVHKIQQHICRTIYIARINIVCKNCLSLFYDSDKLNGQIYKNYLCNYICGDNCQPKKCRKLVRRRAKWFINDNF